MKTDVKQKKSAVEVLGLEANHYRIENVSVPVINSHLYTVLGRRLFDLYQKYSVGLEDQREIESLSQLLSNFIQHREQPAKMSWTKRWGRNS